MSFIDRIISANNCNMEQFIPFRIAGQRVGFVRHDTAERLRQWPKVFQVNPHELTLATTLNDPATPVEQRTERVHEVVLQLREQLSLQHWWDEWYAVNSDFNQPAQLLLERAIVPMFGVCGYGVHINGYVRDGEQLFMWVARRAWDKPSGPGKLDQIVAGGQPAGLSLIDNVVKECAEEADIPASLARRCLPVSAISYCLATEHGLRPDVLYNYDLELPADFTPVNTDGEVDTFYLMPLTEVAERVRDTDEFKFNCALVVIDFLLRHGVIDADDPDYLALQSGLRQREFILAPFNP